MTEYRETEKGRERKKKDCNDRIQGDREKKREEKEE